MAARFRILTRSPISFGWAPRAVQHRSRTHRWRRAMAAKEQPRSGKAPMGNVDPAQFAKVGKKQVDALVEMQQDLIKGMEEMSREWAARIKLESDLANEFARKLSAA